MPVPQFDKQAKPAFIVACVTLLACAVGFQGAVKALNLYLKKEPVELRAPLSLISTTIGRWKAVGPDRTFEDAFLQELGTDKYLDRWYSLDGSATEVVNLHLAYYTGMIGTVPHVPDRCLVAAGFNAKTLPENILLPIDRQGWGPDPDHMINLASGEEYSVATVTGWDGRTVKVYLPVGDLKLRTVRFEKDKAPDQKIYGGYFFIANGRTTPTPEGVQVLAFDPREKYVYYCKVQYIYGSRDATEEHFLELVADHLKGLLPELMRCLPEWPEVERRHERQAAPSST